MKSNLKDKFIDDNYMYFLFYFIYKIQINIDIKNYYT